MKIQKFACVLSLLSLALMAIACESSTSSSRTDVRGASARRQAQSQATNASDPKNARKIDLLPPAATEPREQGDAAPAAAEGTTKPPRNEVEDEPPPEKDPPIPDSFKPLNKTRSLFFEKTAEGKRRVHILGDVCLREGPLEVFLCRNGTKEHEAILHADVDARDIHTALIAAGAKYGSTVKFVPNYQPATGDTIKVSVTYYKDGKLLMKPAQFWVRSAQTKKDMAHDWVFAGSRFFKFPDDPDKPPFYCANNGEVISIANFADSMLDLPVKSSREAAELGFSAATERIPPIGTKVVVTLEPVPADRK